MQLLAMFLYLGQWALLLFTSSIPSTVKLGLILILLSPQWLYLYPIPYPVFEFRGYSMAIGVALIVGWFFRSHPVFVVPLSLFWAWRSHARRQILIEPLRFWERAQEENHGS